MKKKKYKKVTEELSDSLKKLEKRYCEENWGIQKA